MDGIDPDPWMLIMYLWVDSAHKLYITNAFVSDRNGLGTASVLRSEMLHLVICFLYHKHVRLSYVHIMLNNRRSFALTRLRGE